MIAMSPLENKTALVTGAGFQFQLYTLQICLLIPTFIILNYQTIYLFLQIIYPSIMRLSMEEINTEEANIYDMMNPMVNAGD